MPSQPTTKETWFEALGWLANPIGKGAAELYKKIAINEEVFEKGQDGTFKNALPVDGTLGPAARYTLVAYWTGSKAMPGADYIRGKLIEIGLEVLEGYEFFGSLMWEIEAQVEGLTVQKVLVTLGKMGSSGALIFAGGFSNAPEILKDAAEGIQQINRDLEKGTKKAFEISSLWWVPAVVVLLLLLVLGFWWLRGYMTARGASSGAGRKVGKAKK